MPYPTPYYWVKES